MLSCSSNIFCVHLKIIIGVDTSASAHLLVLTASIPEQCINVSLISDGFIEETETVTLSLQLTNNTFGIGSIAPNTTVITIIDKDGKCILD